MLTVHGQRHSVADTVRVYIPAKEGGRGLMQVEKDYTVEVIKLTEFVESKEDPWYKLLGHTNIT